MFGYVTVLEPELKVKDYQKYKAYYCGLCQQLKKQYGSLGQMTLTYDMTFAIIFLTSLYEKEPAAKKSRCKVHPLKKQATLGNVFTEYAADMNLILSYYHLEDDWKDEKKWSSRIAAGMLQKKVRKAIRKYPRQSQAIHRELKSLAACEKENRMEPDEPAGCFGRLMAELLVYQKDHWEERVRALGFYLGKFIYLMDAYEDLEKDEKGGKYNLFSYLRKENRQDFETLSKLILTSMMSECSKSFERLPILEHAEIMRNILYSGVWSKYEYLQLKKKKRRKTR